MSPQRWVLRLLDTKQYLKDDEETLRKHWCPQWYYLRERARVFASAAEARARLVEIRKQWPTVTYEGVCVVRLLSPAESRAKAAAEALRALAAKYEFWRDEYTAAGEHAKVSILGAAIIEAHADAKALWPARPARAPRGTAGDERLR